MRILLTGQVGLDKASYLARVKSECEKLDTNLHTVSIGRLIIERAPGHQSEATILNLPKNELQTLRAQAWRKLQADANNTPREDIFVANSHAVLRWHHGPVQVLELDVLLEFHPEMIVTLIDDIDLIKQGLRVRGTDIFQLWELLAWREEEIYVSRLVSQSLARLLDRHIPFYVLPKKQGPELLARLLVEPNTWKAYLSFPVTGLPEDQRKEVERFKKRLSQEIVCFDPLALSERSIVSKANTLAEDANKELLSKLQQLLRSIPSEEKKQWSPCLDNQSALSLLEFDTGGEELTGQEVIAAMDAIDSQTIARDHTLIEQSDIVVAYIPAEEDDSPRISAGSQSEIYYAYHNGKSVFIVFPGDPQDLSPWVTEFAPGRIFQSVDDCIDQLVAK